MNRDEADRLVHATETFQEKLVVYPLLDMGLRVAELCGLAKDQIQWQESRLVVFGKGGPYGSKSKRRVVPITSERARVVLERHFAIHDAFGMTPRTAQRIVKRVANRAGIARPVTPHVLRHTFSVFALQDGISLAALQKALGHDRLETTEIYLNLSPEDAVREFESKWGSGAVRTRL